MAGGIEIREMEERDAAFVIDGLVDLQNHEHALHMTRRPGDRSLCRKYFEEIRASAAGGGALLLACLDGQRAGFVCVRIMDEPSVLETADSTRYGYVSDIWVGEAHRGRGVAQSLLRAVESFIAADRSLTRLRICALAANVDAIKAYDRAGFAPYEIVFEKPVAR